MRLFEHPDFEQAVLQAAEFFREQGLRPAIIEKDYYVTEALRTLASNAEAHSNTDDSNTSTTIKAFQRAGTSFSDFRKTSTSSSIRSLSNPRLVSEASIGNSRISATQWPGIPD